jgi:hypothetical protein
MTGPRLSFGTVAAALLVLAVLGGRVWAQTAPTDMSIDAATRNQVIDRALALLDSHYVFPDVARKMEAEVRQRQRDGAYDAITSAVAFRAQLERDLRAVSQDKHLEVFYQPPGSERGPGSPAEPDLDAFRASLARRNFCFERVERLAGNVGYVDLRCFGPADVIADTTAAAFSFLGHTRALIVDLRENTGGDPTGVALVSSYLFDRATHLNDIYFRDDNRTQEFWTLAAVPGRRLVDADVYLLTSQRTFSAGEEFAYNLKALRRARIIGEVTGGGAHPVRPHPIDDHFSIGVPFARPVNPTTKTNWEGTGVQPDEQTPAGGALEIAHLRAVERLRATSRDAQEQRELDGVIAMLRAKPDRGRPQP